MIFSILLISIGLGFIVFNKNLVELEKKIRRKKIDNEEYLIKTHLYICAVWFLVMGFWLLGWDVGFFGR